MTNFSHFKRAWKQELLAPLGIIITGLIYACVFEPLLPSSWRPWFYVAGSEAVVSMIIGLAIILVTYLLARHWFTLRLSLVAGLLLAITAGQARWANSFGTMDLVAPLATVLLFYCCTRVAHVQKRIYYWLWAVLAGLSFALIFYSDLALALTIKGLGLLVLLLLLIVDARHQPHWLLVKRYWPAFVTGILTAVAALVPFALDLQTITWPQWGYDAAHVAFLSPVLRVLFIIAFVTGLVQSVLFIISATVAANHSQKRLNLKRLPLLILTLWFVAAYFFSSPTQPLAVIVPIILLSAFFIEELIAGLESYTGPRSWRRTFGAHLVLGFILVFEVLYSLRSLF